MYVRYYILKPFTTLSSPIKILAWLEVCKNVMEFHKSHKLTLSFSFSSVGSFFRLASKLRHETLEALDHQVIALRYEIATNAIPSPLLIETNETKKKNLCASAKPFLVFKNLCKSFQLWSRKLWRFLSYYYFI